MRVLLDENLDHRLKLGIVILMAPSNRLADLEPLMPEVNKVLHRLPAGEVARVSA